MNILHLVSTSGYYGKERCVFELAKRQHSTIGVLGNRQGTHALFADQMKEQGVPHVVFPATGAVSFSAIDTIRTYIKNNHISCIHSHDYKSNFYALLSAMGQHTYRSATVHNWIVTDFKLALYAFIDKCILRFFDVIAVTSREIKKELMKFLIPSEKIVIISNGISIEPFEKQYDQPIVRTSIGIPEKALVVGSVGRLTTEKGHEILLRGFADIVKKNPQTVLLLVGEGPEEATLKIKVQKMNISGNVIFTGFRKNIPEMLSAMNIFVLPSLIEGMPVALLEAMAAHVPVVSTAVGSVPEIIKHKVNGMLVKPGDAQALGEAILFLAHNTEQSRTMADRAYSIVIERYSSAHMAEQYNRFYALTSCEKGNRH